MGSYVPLYSFYPTTLVHSKTNFNSDRVDYTKTGIPFSSTNLKKKTNEKKKKERKKEVRF